MNAEHATFVEEDHVNQDDAPKAVQRAFALDRRQRRSKARSILGTAQAGILKPEP